MYVDVAYSSTVGNNNVSVTSSNGETSNSYSLGLDGPYSLVVEGDVTFYYNNSSANDVERAMTYQIKNFSETNAGATVICEIPVDAPSNPPCSPSISAVTADWCPGVTGHTASVYTTTSDGNYTDEWSLAAPACYYSPAGCGIDGTDPWYWNPQSSIIHELGNPSGYIHTNAIKIYDHVSTPANQNPLSNGITMPK